MPTRGQIEAMAVEVLGVDVDASEDEIQSKYRQMASDHHPDTVDEEDAGDVFTAIQDAKDVLLGEIDFYDPDQLNFLEERLGRALDDETVDRIEREEGPRSSFSSPGGARSDPADFDPADFMGISKEERAELIQEVALGVEALIIYRAIEGLLRPGFTRGDYFDAVNKYLVDEDPSNVEFEDYWYPVRRDVADGVTRDIYIGAIERIQENLQSEFGEGMTLRETAGTIANFIVKGGANLGDINRFVGAGIFGSGGGVFGGDSMFGGSDLYSRGNNPFTGRSHGSGRGDIFGDDPRYD